jgi:hypothetical protein
MRYELREATHDIIVKASSEYLWALHQINIHSDKDLVHEDANFLDT